MSMRRHRVKATANLTNVKRKPRVAVAVPATSSSVTSNNVVATEEHNDNGNGLPENRMQIDQEKSTEIVDNNSALKKCVESAVEHQPSENEATMREIQSTKEINVAANDHETQELNLHGTLGEKDTNAFKMPVTTTVHNQDHDVAHSDIEDSVIQMDLQKTLNGFPMSPSKANRQRVKPTPVFGQRRNSFVCASPSPHAGVDAGDVFTNAGCSTPSSNNNMAVEFMSPSTSQRRERYYSGSAPSTPLQQGPQHKYFPPVMSPGMGRIRTESTCSQFSDTFSVSGKNRKNDEQNKHHRVSAKRDFENRFSSGVPDKSTFKMFDMIYYNPSNSPMEQKPIITTIKAESSIDTKVPKQEVLESIETSAMPVPQLKLNANGEMIIDEKTLEIETTAEQEARKVLANSSLILMDETTGMNGFYKRQKRTRGWNSEETIRFYRALQIIGTDFSLMCELFKGRSRRDLKLKYKKEERVNSALINKALLYPKVFDIEELKNTLEREDREREEMNQKLKEIKKRDPQLTNKGLKEKRSRASRALDGGDFVHINEQVTTRKFGKRTLYKMNAEQLAATREANTESAIYQNSEGNKAKRGRPRASKKNDNTAEPASNNTLTSFATIKQETNFKMEQNQDDVGPYILEAEINELLEPPLMDHHHQGGDENEIVTATQQQTVRSDDFNRFDDEVSKNRSLTNFNYDQCTFVPEQLPVHDDASSSSPLRTAAMSSPLQSPLSHYTDNNNEDSVYNTTHDESIEEANNNNEKEEDFSEHDIQEILTLLADGSLVLVSCADPENPDKILHGIYEIDKESGNLTEDPLDIPESIVHCIVAVMS